MHKDSKLIWLLDCWSVYKLKKIVVWIKEKHPTILLIFVSTDYTSMYHPADVILQRPFKYGFGIFFDIYTIIMIDKQLEEKETKNVNLDFRKSILKSLLCSWLFEA